MFLGVLPISVLDPCDALCANFLANKMSLEKKPSYCKHYSTSHLYNKIFSVALLVGRAWAAATTEGLMLYALSSSIAFTPYDLEMDTTVEQTVELLAKNELGRALVCSLRLNEDSLVKKVMESIKPDDSMYITIFHIHESR